VQRIFTISCLRWEVFFALSGSQLGGKRFDDDGEFETEVQKWLRQQSKDLYAAGFDALLKRRDKCVNVRAGYIEKYMLHSRVEYHIFYVSYPYVTYLLTVLRI
jgi:hypothetical protein